MRTILPDCECLLKKREQTRGSQTTPAPSALLSSFVLRLFVSLYAFASSLLVSSSICLYRRSFQHPLPAQEPKEKDREKERELVGTESRFVTAEWRIIVTPESGAPPTSARARTRSIARTFFTFYPRRCYTTIVARSSSRCFPAATRRVLPRGRAMIRYAYRRENRESDGTLSRRVAVRR